MRTGKQFWSDLHDKLVISLEKLDIENLSVDLFGFNAFLSGDEIKYCNLGYMLEDRLYTGVLGNYVVVYGDNVREKGDAIFKQLAIVGLEFDNTLSEIYNKAREE